MSTNYSPLANLSFSEFENTDMLIAIPENLLNESFYETVLANGTLPAPIKTTENFTPTGGGGITCDLDAEIGLPSPSSGFQMLTLNSDNESITDITVTFYLSGKMTCSGDTEANAIVSTVFSLLPLDGKSANEINTSLTNLLISKGDIPKGTTYQAVTKEEDGKTTWVSGTTTYELDPSTCQFSYIVSLTSTDQLISKPSSTTTAVQTYLTDSYSTDFSLSALVLDLLTVVAAETKPPILPTGITANTTDLQDLLVNFLKSSSNPLQLPVNHHFSPKSQGALPTEALVPQEVSYYISADNDNSNGVLNILVNTQNTTSPSVHSSFSNVSWFWSGNDQINNSALMVLNPNTVAANLNYNLGKSSTSSKNIYDVITQYIKLEPDSSNISSAKADMDSGDVDSSNIKIGSQNPLISYQYSKSYSSDGSTVIGSSTYETENSANSESTLQVVTGDSSNPTQIAVSGEFTFSGKVKFYVAELFGRSYEGDAELNTSEFDWDYKTNLVATETTISGISAKLNLLQLSEQSSNFPTTPTNMSSHDWDDIKDHVEGIGSLTGVISKGLKSIGSELSKLLSADLQNQPLFVLPGGQIFVISEPQFNGQSVNDSVQSNLMLTMTYSASGLA